MICDIRATFEHNGLHIRMCFKPLGIYAMSFRSFPTSYDPYWHFAMFLCYFRCLLASIWLITTLTDYLCILHTLVYLCDVLLTISDLLRPFVVFIYLHSYLYSDLLIIYSYGWLRHYYSLRLRSIQTISYIWSLWHHFDLSKVILTYILPTTPILTEEHCTSFPSPS